MARKILSIDIKPPEGVLSGNNLMVYDKPRKLELEPLQGYLILKAVVEAINHYYALVDNRPKYLVIGYEQYKCLIAECNAYFSDDTDDRVFEEITLLGIPLQVVLLPANIGIHLSGELKDVFLYCAQKELYP